MGLEFKQTPLSTVSVDVPPLLVHVSKVLRSDGESASVDDCIAERTRFSRCRASFTFDFILRLGVRFRFSSSEFDDKDDEDVDEEDDVEDDDEDEEEEESDVEEEADRLCE